MICSFDECNNKFEPHRHNQKYCSSECCKEATNKRIRTKYYATKQRLNGKLRICSNRNCETILSRYTENVVCNKCIAERETEERNSLRRLFGAI